MNLTWSKQFQIISDPIFRGWLSHQLPDYLTFWINFSTFGSTFQINLLNQPMQSTFLLNRRRHWLMIRCVFWQTYVRKRVLLPTEVSMIQVVDLLTDHPLVEAWSISPSSAPWWWCGWKPCWTQLGSPFPPFFPPRFLIEFRRFFYQLNTHGFLFSLLLGLGGFFHQYHDLKRLYTLVGAHIQEEKQL